MSATASSWAGLGYGGDSSEPASRRTVPAPPATAADRLSRCRSISPRRSRADNTLALHPRAASRSFWATACLWVARWATTCLWRSGRAASPSAVVSAASASRNVSSCGSAATGSRRAAERWPSHPGGSTLRKVRKRLVWVAWATSATRSCQLGSMAAACNTVSMGCRTSSASSPLRAVGKPTTRPEWRLP